MLRSVIESSLRLRFVVVAIAAALIVFGITQLPNMALDVLPEFAPPYVEIQTESLGLSAEEVEQLITVPMEHDLLNGVPWLETIRSESVPGLSSIVLVFQPGTDLIRARQMVAERLTQAHALPHVSKPPTMLQPLSATSRVMIIGLASKNLSLIQMSVLARWVIAPRLMGIPGVANVAIWGQRDRQLQVQVDPKQLAAKNVSLLQILETTGNALWVSTLSFVEASTPGTGGFIDTSNQRLGIRHILPIVSPEGLAQVPVEGTELHLGEVANVVEDHQPLIGDALTNDGPSLLLVIEKFPGANTLDVTRDVDSAMQDMSPGLSGMETDSTIFRPADFIQMALNNLTVALLLGVALIGLVLAAFFFAWRTVLISLVAIPVSIIAAAVVFYLTGATLNMIVLTGFVIVIGVVVGDAIMDVENIMRRLRQAREEGSTKSTASLILEASLQVRNVILYATLILVLAVSPLFFLGGQSGAFFQPMTVSYILALLASTLVALTVTPALCLILLANAPIAKRESPLVRWLQQVYAPLMARIMPHGRMAFVAVGVLTLVGLILMPFLTPSLLPSFKERNLVIHLNGAPGTSQPEMSRVANLVSNELRSIPGVHTVAAHVGRAVLGDQVVNVSSAELWVTLDSAAPYDATVSSVETMVNNYPGLALDVQTYLSEKIKEVLTEQSNSIVVRLYGDNADILRTQAEDIKKALTGINGIVDTRIALPVQQPTFEIQVDLAQAQRYGIKPGDVRRAAATLLSGILVGNLFEDQKVFDVVVWGTPETRNSMSSIQDLQIDTPEGGHVRLGDVAQVRIAPTASVIRHESVKRYLDIVSSVRGRDLGAVAGEINGRLDQVQFPLEYHAEVMGEYATQQNAQTRLLLAAIAAVIGIFFLLQAAYGSWRLAFLSLFTLPSALVGGLIATSLTGGVLSLGSLVGLLAVFAVAVRSQILLIHHYQHLAKQTGKTPDAALLLSGATELLVPMLMTTITAGLALMPALFLGDIPGLEIVRPMAIVLLGGMTTSSLLNLFILPALVFTMRMSPARELDLAPAAEGTLDGMMGGVMVTGE